ncbi:MAG: hypothetical protein LBN07_04620 [Christensenellaceae bacterium]|jgi:hypothetical protein|nr:hypothetical protein [Christensenellaceae bacterium]
MSDANQRLIFCLECNGKNSTTDKDYVSKIIRYYYGVKPDYQPVYMDGKGNYKSIRTKRQIKKVEAFSSGMNIVIIYFIDMDGNPSSLRRVAQKELDEITTHCRENDYELILFAKEIEDVLKIDNRSNKMKAAQEFIENPHFERIDEQDLRKTLPLTKAGQSNILLVLDKYFK